MQSILRDCNGLTVYGPSNFTPHVVMILGGRHSGRGQARKEWAPVLRGQGEAAGIQEPGNMTHQTWHLLMILGLPSLQDYKKQLSVVYQLVYGIYNSSPKRRRQGSLMVKDREAWRAAVHGSQRVGHDLTNDHHHHHHRLI